MDKKKEKVVDKDEKFFKVCDEKEEQFKKDGTPFGITHVFEGGATCGISMC